MSEKVTKILLVDGYDYAAINYEKYTNNENKIVVKDEKSKEMWEKSILEGRIYDEENDFSYKAFKFNIDWRDNLDFVSFILKDFSDYDYLKNNCFYIVE